MVISIWEATPHLRRRVWWNIHREKTLVYNRWIAEMIRNHDFRTNCVVPGTESGKSWRLYLGRITKWIACQLTCLISVTSGRVYRPYIEQFSNTVSSEDIQKCTRKWIVWDRTNLPAVETRHHGLFD